jgi:hypothetical protein
MDIRSQTVSLLRLRLPSSVLRKFEPHPQGFKNHPSERLALSLLPGCPPTPASHRPTELQHQRPTVDPSVPPFASIFFADAAPAHLSGEYSLVFSRVKTYWAGRAGDPSVGVVVSNTAYVLVADSYCKLL